MKIKKGFTLIEMIISMGILVIMSTALAGTFSSGFSSYGSSRELQRNLETAQYALNTLEKLLRTSSISGTPIATSMTFYDYSSGKCFRYRIITAGSSSALAVQWFPTDTPSVNVSPLPTPSGCGSSSDTGTNCPCHDTSLRFTPSAMVTSGYVTGSFNAIPSTISPKTMGRVTVNLSVKKDNNPLSLGARVQATASLRDYSYVGY